MATLPPMDDRRWRAQKQAKCLSDRCLYSKAIQRKPNLSRIIPNRKAFLPPGKRTVYINPCSEKL